MGQDVVERLIGWYTDSVKGVDNLRPSNVPAMNIIIKIIN